MKEGVLTHKLRLRSYSTKIYNLRVMEDRDEHNISEWSIAIRKRAKRYAEKIAEEIRRINKDLGRLPKVAVIAANTKEAGFLWEELKKKLKEYEKDIIVVHYKVGDNPQRRLNEFKRKERGILVAVRMIDIGFDDPNLEVLFIAKPVYKEGSYLQVRGRVLRKPASNDNMKSKLGYALIVDLVGKVVDFEKKIREIEDRMFKEGIDLDKEFEVERFKAPKPKPPEDIPEADAEVRLEHGVEWETSPTRSYNVEDILTYLVCSLDSAVGRTKDQKRKGYLRVLKKAIEEGECTFKLSRMIKKSTESCEVRVSVIKDLDSKILRLEITGYCRIDYGGKRYINSSVDLHIVDLIKRIQEKVGEEFIAREILRKFLDGLSKALHVKSLRKYRIRSIKKR